MAYRCEQAECCRYERQPLAMPHCPAPLEGPTQPTREMECSGRLLSADRSMPEMADAGEEHRQAVLVARRDRVGVAFRAARLRDGRHADASRGIDVVAAWEECVGRQHCPAAALARLLRRDLDRIDPA